MRPRFIHLTQFVRQGCCLSLWFIYLFIDDLNNYISGDNAHDLVVDNSKARKLLLADCLACTS
jgi:hypothetical protein